MRNESVAILDVRSYEVTFFLGSKGVNDIFVIYDSHTEKYEGFSTDGLFDEDSFRRAVVKAVTSVRQNYEGVIGEIYVGTPSAFVSVATKGHTISFPSKRKLSVQDIDALFASGLNELLAKERCIRHSEMYFTLGDNRKYFNVNDLYGVPTTLLKGALCYYFIQDGFCEAATRILNNLEFKDIKFLPSTLAQALYLFPEKHRDDFFFGYLRKRYRTRGNVRLRFGYDFGFADGRVRRRLSVGARNSFYGKRVGRRSTQRPSLDKRKRRTHLFRATHQRRHKMQFRRFV